jgi:hypothetical protein
VVQQGRLVTADHDALATELVGASRRLQRSAS